MPVIAPPSYENQKAGSALETAAEEILNGIFCHYEPPTSTKAQKKAARAVHDQPTKFLYEEQKTRPVLTKKKKKIETPSSQVSELESEVDYETETDVGDYDDDEASVGEEELEEDLETFEPDTPGMKGIKWRDEESKRIEEEKANAAKPWSQCITLPCFVALDGQVDEIPEGLEDIQDENDKPHEPTPTFAPTPTKSALKRTDDSMKVLYDDEGNPNTTPRSPGSIRNHVFFRNVNSPRTPKEYIKPPKKLSLPAPPTPNFQAPTSPAVPPPTPNSQAPTSPAVQDFLVPENKKVPVPVAGSSGVTDYNFATSLAMQNSPRIRQIAPLPGSPGITDQLGGPQVIRLAKVGRKPKAAPAPVQTTMPSTPDAWAAVDPSASPARSFIAKSPKQYMAPVPVPVNAKPEVQDEQQKSVLELVQVLNKAGFNPGRKFNRGYSAKSFRRNQRAPKTPSTKHHGYATANDNRGPLEGEARPSFVGTRRVAAPAPLVASNPSPGEARPARYQRPMALNTEIKEDLEITRDPTPRQMKIQELEDKLRRKAALPPTPRHKAKDSESTPALIKDRQEEEEMKQKQTEIKQKKEEVGAPRERSTKRNGSTESRQKQQKQQRQPKSSSKKEKNGFMSGIKKGFGKLKTVVNDIDSQRIQQPTPTSNKRSSSSRGGGRQVRKA